MLQSVRSQRVGHNRAADKQKTRFPFEIIYSMLKSLFGVTTLGVPTSYTSWCLRGGRGDASVWAFRVTLL